MARDETTKGNGDEETRIFACPERTTAEGGGRRQHGMSPLIIATIKQF